MKNLIFLLFILFVNKIIFAQNIDNIDFYKSLPIRVLPKEKEVSYGADYKEDRGPEYAKYLSPGAKITVSGGSGSGTIIYYDELDNTAYVATCGHLWPAGVLKNKDAKIKKLKCYLTFWYKNGTKLDMPIKYEGEVLFYSFTQGCDTALVKFNPDFKPNYFRIAPKDYIYKKGASVHSIGCDGAREIAHYDMEILGVRGNNLIAIKNSPRPGRSGGGLIDENGLYIGTCWGTTSMDGDGEGFFTPLSTIYSFWKENNFGHILINKDAQKIKVYDSINKKLLKNEEVLLPIFLSL